MLEEIGAPLQMSAGVTHDALLSTIVGFLVSRADEAQPAEVAMAADIIKSLSNRASFAALEEAREKLEAASAAFAGLITPPAQIEAEIAGQVEDEIVLEAIAEPLPERVIAEPEPALASADPDLELSFEEPVAPAIEEVALVIEKAAPVVENVAPAFGSMCLTGADVLDPVAEAATCGPGRLVMLAQLPDVPEALSNRIVARGHAEALVAVLTNPSARFAKSSLTTIVELAASDYSLRQALCHRGDLPDAILDRLWPFLSQASRVQVIHAGCTTEQRALTALLAEADQDLIMAVREGELPLSIDTCLARMADGEWTLARAIKALGQEGRIADVATLLARKACAEPTTALALLMGAYDRGLVALARAAQADVPALEALLVVRTRAGCRRTNDGRGPLHALSGMTEAD
ncbi:MAG: DUF2336 domain-containing protein, partial [Bosea sp. (in: a-proteobacteria)]